MPEVVYPSGDRTWDQVFPDIPDGADDWKVINDVLYAIALNNRFGDRNFVKLQAELTEQVRSNLQNFLSTAKTEDEKANIRKSAEMYDKYIPEVFKNLGGAYREHKSTLARESHTTVAD
jgi:hypothetical protein